MRCTISLRQAYGSTGVMSRGDRYENIYLDDVDRQDFLKTLAVQVSVLTIDTFGACW